MESMDNNLVINCKDCSQTFVSRADWRNHSISSSCRSALVFMMDRKQLKNLGQLIYKDSQANCVDG
jgi:hypothetical protein